MTCIDNLSDLQHHMWKILLDRRLYLAPMKQEPKDVLDIGTGTGIWAIKFANKHPNSKVVGTDLSLIQPSNAPPNCTFVREDADGEWTLEQQFDLVHLRMMCTCFADSRGVMQKVFDHLRPGGWVEYQDYAFETVGADEAVDEALRGSAIVELSRLMIRGMANKYGRDITSVLKHKQWMQEMGFTDIKQIPYLCPINSWSLNPKDFDLGRWMHLDILNFIEGTTKMLQAGGLAVDQIPGFLDLVRADLANADLRAYNICKYNNTFVMDMRQGLPR